MDTPNWFVVLTCGRMSYILGRNCAKVTNVA